MVLDTPGVKHKRGYLQFTVMSQTMLANAIKGQSSSCKWYCIGLQRPSKGEMVLYVFVISGLCETKTLITARYTTKLCRFE